MTKDALELYLGYALTPIHVGVGSYPGVVDLPVARDGYGYPYIPGSSVKGSVKSKCVRSRGRDECTWLYGREPRGVQEELVKVSPVGFTDAYLLFYPVQLLLRGGEAVYGLATSPLLLSRFIDMAVAAGIGVDEVILCRRMFDKEIMAVNNQYIGADIGVNVVTVKIPSPLLERISLLRLLGAGGEECPECIRVLEFPDTVFLDIVEAGLLRQTRVRLDPYKKVVERGALWTEEYVSQGALFYFAATYRARGSVKLGELVEGNHGVLLGNEASGYTGLLVIGGKETIGKGMLVVTPWMKRGVPWVAVKSM